MMIPRSNYRATSQWDWPSDFEACLGFKDWTDRASLVDQCWDVGNVSIPGNVGTSRLVLEFTDLHLIAWPVKAFTVTTMHIRMGIFVEFCPSSTRIAKYSPTSLLHSSGPLVPSC